MFSIREQNQENLLKDQIQTHKASFRYNDLVNTDLNHVDFRHKKAVFFVSVGQDYHEKGKLLATIELINKYPFERCDIVMADTLQRHNHRGRLNEDALEFALNAGHSWLKRNNYALKKFLIPHNIIRWDDFLNHAEYADLYQKITHAYHENKVYQDAILSNVMAYIERLTLLNPETDHRSLITYGLDYLIEECPIVMPLWARMGYDYIIYPKPLTPGMKMTRELFVEKQYPDKCQWLFLRFKKK